MPNSAPLLQRHAVEFLRLTPRHAQRLPLARAQMLRQKHDLANVKYIVRQRPVQRLHHRVRFLPDVHRPRQVLRLQSFQRVQHHTPSLLPPPHQFLAAWLLRQFKFLVAMPVRLLAIGSQKLREPRAHVPRDVLHEDRDRVRFCIQRHKEVLVLQLRQRPFRQPLVPAHLPPNFLEKLTLNATHGIPPLRLRPSPSAPTRRLNPDSLPPAQPHVELPRQLFRRSIPTARVAAARPATSPPHRSALPLRARSRLPRDTCHLLRSPPAVNTAAPAADTHTPAPLPAYSANSSCAYARPKLPRASDAPPSLLRSFRNRQTALPSAGPSPRWSDYSLSLPLPPESAPESPAPAPAAAHPQYAATSPRSRPPPPPGAARSPLSPPARSPESRASTLPSPEPPPAPGNETRRNTPNT